jgi:hypothetical protein
VREAEVATDTLLKVMTSNRSGKTIHETTQNHMKELELEHPFRAVSWIVFV